MTAAAPQNEHFLLTSSHLLDPRNWWKAYILAWLPLGLSYLIILGVFVDIDGSTLLVTWLANILYPSVVSIGVVWLCVKEIIHKPPRFQIIIHTLGAVAFSALWALTLFRLLQLFNGLLTSEWTPPIWPSAVIAWQLFQGLALYFIIVSGTYAFWALSKLKQNGLNLTPDPIRTRIYSRSELGLVPVTVDEISAVSTSDGATLLIVGPAQLESRMAISELEALLPLDKFVRIHRTALVNLDHIQSLEPAGNGRQTVHLKNGMTFESSRAGSTALKSRFSIV
ncbi:MAG: LytTR family transcriptional regulator DNA-binding domain-containing protein [Henriciella sp.]|nr:LytTR family transcriptional regulator DNA-binding domain-containing protein [Henriciella sp.]